MDDPPATSIRKRRWIGDEIAYLAPMLAFCALASVGAEWKSLYPAAYVSRAIVTAILLIALRRHYTKISWKFWWLGILVGIVGIVQWVGMQNWIEAHFAYFKPDPNPFNPLTAFASPATTWTFIVIRIASAAIVVPFMEELFWRDWLWRQFIAPADFKLAKIGEWDPLSFFLVAAAFATVHGNWWPTAIVWGLLIATLLVYTRSLGACILAHATTNLLLAFYVLHTHAWALW